MKDIRQGFFHTGVLTRYCGLAATLPRDALKCVGQGANFRQFKPSFLLTNTTRVAFLAAFSIGAFAWGKDIIEPFDPFKIYKPLHLGLLGAAGVGIILIASLFVYRPWCHFFCPFGLVGWCVEKLSRVKVSVDYKTCIACRKCATACPSTVMGAILRRDKITIPDCFACYTCRDVCPTGSIRFSREERTLPPPGHFQKERKGEVPETSEISPPWGFVSDETSPPV